eukprot:1630-Prymnesium_polylepis.1
MPAVLGAAAATEAIRRAGARAAARRACGGRKGRARVGTGRVVRRLAAERGDAPQLIKIVGAKAAGRQHAELARKLAEGLAIKRICSGIEANFLSQFYTASRQIAPLFLQKDISVLHSLEGKSLFLSIVRRE